MPPYDRRQFARLMLGGTVAALLGGCGSKPGLRGTDPPDVPSPAVVGSASPSESGLAPTVSARGKVLRNENVRGFYVRYYRPFEAVDSEQWRLQVDGLVQNPQQLALEEVLALPRRAQISRMKCVECWSAVAKWEGFHLSALVDLVKPLPQASWVYMSCADGYYEAMSIEGLLRERVLFVHHMNDQILPDIYGAPLRLMVPFLYGCKSAKALVRIEFGDHEQDGYWSTAGPYTSHGSIRAGFDHPLDLEGSREIEGGRELFYPDGIEAAEQVGS